MIVRAFALSLVALAAAGCANVRGERPTLQRAAVVTEPVCQDMSFPIYFETGSTQLTQPALQLVRSTAQAVGDCTVREVLVLGLADADGSANRNLQLSRQRAETVAAALVAQGFPAPSFDIEASGDIGAVAPSGEPEPLRRRAEIVVRLGPPLNVAAPAST